MVYVPVHFMHVCVLMREREHVLIRVLCVRVCEREREREMKQHIDWEEL